MTKHMVSLAVLAAVLAWSTPSIADEAGDLLTKMRSAVHTLNYSGTLVYSQGNELSNYQISHTLENGAEKESVVRLTQGKGTADESVESFSLAKFQQVQPQMEDVYSLDFGGKEFVANRECQIVVARPRDKMRYLQRYCIEPESGMLLKYSLVDRSHRSVEQLMFTVLDVTTPQGSVSAAVQEAVTSTPTPQKAVATTDWVFTSLPVGFAQVQDLQPQPSSGKGGASVRHIILSDGMTSVSVFIADPSAASMENSVAFAAGAMNIYTAEVDHYKVTLLGEVPVTTLQSISEGLKHAR